MTHVVDQNGRGVVATGDTDQCMAITQILLAADLRAEVVNATLLAGQELALEAIRWSVICVCQLHCWFVSVAAC
jgi:hypothetical protein